MFKSVISFTIVDTLWPIACFEQSKRRLAPAINAVTFNEWWIKQGAITNRFFLPRYPPLCAKHSLQKTRFFLAFSTLRRVSALDFTPDSTLTFVESACTKQWVRYSSSHSSTWETWFPNLAWKASPESTRYWPVDVSECPVPSTLLSLSFILRLIANLAVVCRFGFSLLVQQRHYVHHRWPRCLAFERLSRRISFRLRRWWSRWVASSECLSLMKTSRTTTSRDKKQVNWLGFGKNSNGFALSCWKKKRFGKN